VTAATARRASARAGSSSPEALLRRLEWRVVRRLDGRLQGAYRTAFRGSGIDFDGLRGYTAEDDVRHIDWNVTARLDEPYVRQYLQDRELTAWLVLDQSASMRLGAHEGKDSVVASLAVALAKLFTHGGNRVGAILYDNGQHRTVPPATGRTHVLRLTHEITKPVPARRDGRPTDLAAMLHLAAATARRRSLIFVVSDFIGEGDWSAALSRLGQRHEVVTIRVVDPAEERLPDVGLIVVEDAETGEQLLVDASDPLFQQRFRAQVAQREGQVEQGMRRARVGAHRVGTDEDLVTALVGMARRSRAGR
jgi:uncharacterized protein (DUF58 family)